MSNQGINRVGNLVWDESNNKWVPMSSSGSTLSTVQISGITPVGGKLPVDTELTIEGNVIVEDVKIKSAPLTEVYPSGTYAQIIQSDDLVTEIQYNEPSAMTTVSGVTYTSAVLGTTVLETYVSGINTLTITRA